MMNHLKLGTAVAAGLLCAGVSSPGTEMVFRIDPNQSILTLSGTAFGLAFSEQPGHAGSLSDSWSGTITADFTGGVLTFASGSSISALLNTSASPPFSTVPHSGVPAGSVDNYGVFAAGIVNGLNVEVNGAYRTLTLDIPSGTATLGAPAAGMNLSFTSGHLEWGVVLPPDTPAGEGSSSLVGVTGLNVSAGSVTLTAEGVLTLPIQFSTTGANRTEEWSGVIVAAVPEPASISLILAGLGVYCFRRLRITRSR